jgi:hypothetical protein
VPADSAVVDPLGGESVTGAGLAKAEALGRFVGRMAVEAGSGAVEADADATVHSVRAGVQVSADNDDLVERIGAGLMPRYVSTDSLLTSEMHMILIGEVWVLALPGEVFPELVNGGITAQEGADYEGRPESPSHRPLMLGSVNMVAGNAGDALGPIVPYVEWDRAAPLGPGRDGFPVEESRSAGPRTANVLQRGFINLMRSSAAFAGSGQRDK